MIEKLIKPIFDKYEGLQDTEVVRLKMYYDLCKAFPYLLKFDGDYIIRYSDYKRIAKWDGTYLLQYANSRRIAILECPGRRSSLAAAAYLLN